MKLIDKRGLIWFLSLTFFSTYLVEILMMFYGVSFVGIPPIAGQLIVAVVMFFPGISAFIVRKYITKEGFNDAGLQLGKGKYYLQTHTIIPIVFIIIYSLSWMFVQRPDFSLQTFTHQYGIPKLPLAPLPFILAIYISTITLAPFINAIPAFGEEFGWRGFLLPKLLPLGTKRALILSGLIWGLWHAPIILMGFKYGEQGVWGILFFAILLIFIGIYIGYLRLVSGSVYLAAFAHGALNAQAYGIWTLLSPSINPLIGGWTGIVGIIVFSIVGFWVFRKLDTSKQTEDLIYNNTTSSRL